ncbi:uncharacterized protein BP5553_08256 [Venustampulla echinocandica]|uniref:N-acetyltransferase domain-containing protein n=1 Tax=Venustampulla echinocandica TaxID=2656787 RepID=A0A370TG63_9HELO|nr:uncharacterized protein BP5553_08256 [Venustampulla echinocandica]RDL33888.1 hypothetical protein BP5553_08256 [Venustampulla echinocandica]
MAMTLGNRRTTGLRTYSKRDNANTEAPSSKKRRVEDISTAENLVPAPENLSPATKIPRSSIKSYFTPRPRSPSPRPVLCTSLSSDGLEPHEALTPPSSPPAIEVSHISHPKQAQKRLRRRLTTRHSLPLELDMSSRKMLYFEGELDDIGLTGASEKKLQQVGSRPVGSTQSQSANHGQNHPSNNGVIPNQPLPIIDCGGSGSTTTNTTGAHDVRSADDNGDAWPYKTKGPYEHWRSSTPPPLTKPPRELLSDKTWAPYPPDVDPALPSAAIDIPPRSRRKPYGMTYTQTQIDLGLSNTIHCDKCEMPYNPSITEDTLAHREYCKLRAMPELQKKEVREGNFVWKDIIEGAHHRIRVITTYSHPEQRAIAEVIIKRTYEDLPGLQYNSDDLWFQIQNPLDPEDENQVPRFKLYTYYIDSKVVGVLLVERYTMDHEPRARGSVAQQAGNEGPSKHLVFDRLWVLTTARRKGYARRLADTARSDFIRGLHVKKHQVLMSEPTSKGSLWAARYFAA